MKYSVIDIGSNSVRLLLWADGCSVYKKINTTRLGSGVEKDGALSEEAIARTVLAVEQFSVQARQDGAKEVFAFATAAVRSAKNGADFVLAVKNACGLDVDVISGEEEARIGLLGALEGRDGGIIDVGGASSEVTVGKRGKIVYAVSADVGAVRLKDACGENIAALRSFIDERIAVYGEIPRSEMTAVGGTATTLAALVGQVEPYDPQKTHGMVISTEEVLFWSEKLLSMPQEERLRLKGMDKNRADILGGGLLLLYSVLCKAGAERFTVSEKDNMEGYLLDKCGRDKS